VFLEDGLDEGLLAVFLNQQVGVLEGDLDVDALEEGVAEGEDVALVVVVFVFAHQGALDALFALGFVGPHGRDVDEQPVLRVDPARVDDVEPVALVADHVVGVDLEQVCSSVRHAGEEVVVLGHVVVFGQEGDGALCHLDVYVAVPWEDLLVPPPAEQGAVHDPGLGADVSHGAEKGLHECCQVRETLFLADLLDGEAAIVMWVKV